MRKETLEIGLLCLCLIAAGFVTGYACAKVQECAARERQAAQSVHTQANGLEIVAVAKPAGKTVWANFEVSTNGTNWEPFSVWLTNH